MNSKNIHITILSLAFLINIQSFSQFISPSSVTIYSNESVDLILEDVFSLNMQWEICKTVLLCKWTTIPNATGRFYNTGPLVNNGTSDVTYKYRVSMGSNLYSMEAVITIKPSLPINFTYDSDGNMTARRLLLSSKSGSLLKSGGNTDISAILNDDDFPTPKPGTGEEFLNDFKITIYPNPTKGNLQIDLVGSIPINSQMTLYNSYGTVIKKINSLSISNILDISSYPSGIYVLYIYLGNEQSIWKIIKE